MNRDIISDLNRRDFLRGGSVAAFMTMLGGVPILAADEKPAAAADGATNYKGETPPVNIGVIGCGAWGREILKTLSLISFTPVVAICDNYPAYLKRGAALAPKAEKYEDYTKLLENKDVQAVVVATPTHLHKDIALAALAAGKHVYCEAPLATTAEDARAIATAAAKNLKVNFQPGLQARSDKQIVNLVKFIRTGVVGNPLKARAQFHKKMSWRIASSNPEREKDLNWRLDSKTSLGLVGEIGIHQVDLADWLLTALPESVAGVGALLQYKDGRDVFDTVQALFQYPNGIQYSYEATIGNSFDAELNVLYGTDCAILARDRRAWMFKEADAPLLGWEVYAVKEPLYTQSGIVLKAGGTKQSAQKEAQKGPEVVDEKSPLQYALENFAINSYNLGAGVKDFAESFGEGDDAALKEFLKGQDKNRQPAADVQDGFDATIAVIKANEAIMKGTRVDCPKDAYKLA